MTYFIKLACTVVLVFTFSVQDVADPVQPPVQLTKINPGSGAAVTVTAVPGATLAEHVLPQLIPPTLLVIKPLPPEVLTERVGLVIPPPPPPPVVAVGAAANRSRQGQFTEKFPRKRGKSTSAAGRVKSESRLEIL